MDLHWRDGDPHAKPTSSYCCIRSLKARLLDPADTFDVQLVRVLALCAIVALICYALVWLALCLAAHHLWLFIMPFVLLVMALSAALHLLVTRKLCYARTSLVIALMAFTFGSQWSPDEYTCGSLVWALWAPQFVTFSGGTFKESLLCLSLVVPLVCISTIVRIVVQLPPGAPRHSTWVLIMDTVTLVFHGCISSLLTSVMVSQLQSHVNELSQNGLQSETSTTPTHAPPNPLSMEAGTASRNTAISPSSPLADQVSNFDRPNSDQCVIAWADEASQMRSPVRRWTPTCDPEAGTGASGEAGGEEVVPTPGSVASHFSLGLVSPRHISPLDNITVGHHLRTGTILYIRLHEMENFAKQAFDPLKVEQMRKAANLFIDVVSNAIKGLNAIQHYITYDSCLLSWNFIQPCRMHADHACQAAVLIQRRLLMKYNPQDMAPLVTSMGLWSGSLVSGTLGSEGNTFSSLLGHGISSVQALQQYAVASCRGIIGNVQVQQRASATQKWSFLPVDVVAINPMKALDERDNGPTELIYELLGPLAIPDDEWMYQLQSIADNGSPTDELAQLLLEAQGGVKDHGAFEKALLALFVDDTVVADVARRLHRLLRSGALSGPYHQQLLSTWVSSNTLSGWLKPKERTKSIAFSFPFLGRQFSIRRSSSACGDNMGTSSYSELSRPDTPSRRWSRISPQPREHEATVCFESICT